jgi:hypothetical protein
VAAYRVNDDTDRLELPIDRDFLSLPPKLTPGQYVAWCEERIKNPISTLVSIPEEPVLPRTVFDL